MDDPAAPSPSSLSSDRSRSDHVLTTAAAPTAAWRRLRQGADGPRRRRRPRPPVNALVAELHDLYRKLVDLDSLAPGPNVDSLFSRLVALVVTMGATEARAVLDDPRIQAIVPRLRDLCAAGETELERAWADRIAGLDAPHALAELDRFPYLDNYRLLTELEWSAVLGVTGSARPTRVAFVGCGPLPLSPLLLARHHGVAVDAYDRCPRAVDQARAVLAAIPPGPDLRVRHGDTARCPDLRDYDLVVLAALVGSTAQEKHAAIDEVHARMRPGAVLAARSAHLARSLLYPVLDLEALAELELLSVVHPLNQVINSIVLARKWAGCPQHAWAPTPAPNNEVRPWPAS